MANRLSSFRVLAVVALIVAASAVAFAGSLDRTAQGGAVQGLATPINLDNAAATTIDFTVELNTHSVPLTFVISTDALLSDGKNHSVAATTWTGGRGGHHVSGTLSFPSGDLREARELVLSLRVGGQQVPLVFQWDNVQQIARK